MFEAHIVLQKIAAQHSFESLLAENNNTDALHHRYTQSLIPRQGRLQPVGLIYFKFFFYFCPRLEHLLTTPLLPITLKIIVVEEGGEKPQNKCTLPRETCNADYSVCELIRSVSEYGVSR